MKGRCPYYADGNIIIMKLIRTIKRTVGSILVLQTGAISKNTNKTLNSTHTRGGRVQGVHTPPPRDDDEMTHYFLQHCINTLQSASQLYKICCFICYVFSAVHTMLLPSQKPSRTLTYTFNICVRHHFLVVHPLLRKILDPPLHTTK